VVVVATIAAVLPGGKVLAAPADYTDQASCERAGHQWSNGSCVGATSKPPIEDLSLKEQMIRFTKLTALMGCINWDSGEQHDYNSEPDRYNDNTYISWASAQSGNWFQQADWASSVVERYASYLLPSEVNMDDNGLSGKTTCNTLATQAPKLFGFGSSVELLCAMGAPQFDTNQPCDNATKGFRLSAASNASLYEAVNKKLYGATQWDNSVLESLHSDEWDGGQGGGGYPGFYFIYLAALENGCKAKTYAPGVDRVGGYDYGAITLVGPDRKPMTVYYQGTFDMNSERGVLTPLTPVDGGFVLNEVKTRCSDIAASVSKYAADYVKYLEKTDSPVEAGGGAGVVVGCDANPDDPACQAEEATSCNISGVGWLLCPILTFGADLADQMFSVLADSFLRTNPSLLNTDPNATTEQGTVIGTGTYTAWGIIRGIANVAFILVFLIIIISQVSGLGVQNYGVKKLLPRLFIGAILLNLSFFICQIAIDLSNLLGYSLKDALDGIAGQVSQTTGTSSLPDESGNVGGGLLAGLVGVVIVGGAVALGALPMIIAAIVAGVIALFTVFLILITRQALIVLLVVMAPLAFVAYLLPNTESWFKRWRQTFTALLLVFPMLGLLFGACALASGVLLAAVGPGDTLMQIVAYIVLVVPLFAIIPLMRGALNGVGKLSGVIQGLGTKAGLPFQKLSGIGAGAADAARRRALGRTGFAQRRREKIGEKDAIANQRNSTYRALRRSGVKPGEARQQAKSFAHDSVADHHEAEQTKIASTMLARELAAVRSGTHPTYKAHEMDRFLEDRAKSAAHSPAQRAAAMQTAASLGRSSVIRSLNGHFEGQGDAGAADRVSIQRAVSDNANALLGKAPDLIKGADPAFNNVKGQDLASFSPDTAKSHLEHLQALYQKANSPTATQEEKDIFQLAAGAFSSAVEDITKNPTLQAAFGADVGRQIVGMTTPPPGATPTAFQAWASASLTGLAAIQPDGKIR
jgi:hypothetical protein